MQINEWPGSYLNTFNFISFLLTVLFHYSLYEKVSNYFWVIITTWNNMTGITPGNPLVVEALIQQIHYLHFAGSGLASSFLIAKGKNTSPKPFPNFPLLCSQSLSFWSTSEAFFSSFLKEWKTLLINFYASFYKQDGTLLNLHLSLLIELIPYRAQ